jgi:HPt (histidine-containing phosphotransfer) domain-containing protein
MIGHRPGCFEQVNLGGEDAEQELDPAAILARFDGNVRLLQELVTIFMEECPKQMEEIRDAITRDDASGLRYSAHQLRGSVGNFGTFAAYERARQLEQIARTGDLASAADVYAVLQKAIVRFQEVLSRLVQECPEAGMLSRRAANIVKSQALEGPRQHGTLENNGRQQINP